MIVYALFDLDGTPIYIGAGGRDRLKRWSWPSYWRAHSNQPIARRLMEIGHLPCALEILSDLPEAMAHTWEVGLIQSIGQVCVGTGPLLNVQLGGPGAAIPDAIRVPPKPTLAERLAGYTAHQRQSVAKKHLRRAL